IIKARERIIQNEGDGIFGGQHKVADGKADGEIELVEGALTQMARVPRQRVIPRFGKSAEAAIKEYFMVSAAGEGGED
ncbi:MAG: hypothetical protein RR426_10015, partial [Oscillospiraceae bacterium]